MVNALHVQFSPVVAFVPAHSRVGAGVVVDVVGMAVVVGGAGEQWREKLPVPIGGWSSGHASTHLPLSRYLLLRHTVHTLVLPVTLHE